MERKRKKMKKKKDKEKKWKKIKWKNSKTDTKKWKKWKKLKNEQMKKKFKNIRKKSGKPQLPVRRSRTRGNPNGWRHFRSKHPIKGTPTSGCACAHPREYLRGHVTNVTLGHFWSGPLPVTSLAVATPHSTSANVTWKPLIYYLPST
jgi:hypothetical protein